MKETNVIVAMGLVILLCLACSLVTASESVVVNGVPAKFAVGTHDPQEIQPLTTIGQCSTDDCISKYVNSTMSPLDGAGYGGIHVTSNPTGASVYGWLTTQKWGYFGTTPYDFYDLEGGYSYNIKVSKYGYVDQSRLVPVNTGYWTTAYFQLVPVTAPPVASFTGTPTTGTAPLTVTFTDTSTNTPTSWSWNFGDGSTSTTKNPSHAYTSAGTYTVKLTATNSAGSNLFTRTNYITVRSSGGGPVANFVGTPTSGTAPLTVQFTDFSTNMLTYSSAQNPQESGSGFITKTIPVQGTLPQVTPDSSSPSRGYYGRYPLMHFTKDQMDEMQNQIKVSTKYSAPQNTLATGSKNLLSYLPYTPSERDQGQCGDCWVWAATGALEIDHNIKSGISDRLSIQYFNSKYNSGSGSNWACCGGWLSTFTNWYRKDKTPIPWSNTNAGFGDASRICEKYATAVPISSISSQPNYQLNSISYSTISTYGKTQATAINNIKSALNSNKAVEYSFYYGDSGWNDFQNFWGDDSETTIFDPTSHNGEVQTGGHSVLIVGYDDSTDPNNPYWLVVNSWGVTSKRPNGLFRLKMNMNYDSVYYYSGYTYQQHIFEILNSDFAGSTTSWSWNFGDGSTGTSQNPSHTYTSTGTYSVALTATNSAGSNTLTRTNYITVGSPTTTASTIGVFRQGVFYLRNSNSAGNANTVFSYGAATDKPIVGDWTGKGYDTVGVFRSGTFYLRNSNSAGNANTVFSYGAATDKPIAGDWNGDGMTEVGVFSNGVFKLRSSTGGTYAQFNYGTTGDTPIAGDWNGDGTTEVGVFSKGLFNLRGSTGGTYAQFNYGTTGDVPVAGKWM